MYLVCVTNAETHLDVADAKCLSHTGWVALQGEGIGLPYRMVAIPLQLIDLQKQIYLGAEREIHNPDVFRHICVDVAGRPVSA